MVFNLEGYSETNGHALSLLFPQLREINISCLSNLSYVWGNAPNRVQGFQNLRSLTISNCDSLKHVFTSAIVRAIMNLEELKGTSCALVENLVIWSINNEDDNNKRHVTNIGFNKLYHLSFSRLPKLVSIICSNSLELRCPSLRRFEIYECPMLEISLLPTHIHAKRDMYNLNVTYSSNTDSSNRVKENNSSSSSD